MDNSGFLKTFLEESVEWVATIESGLRKLENNPNDMDTVNEIFRTFHNIKGVASTLELMQLKSATHSLEDLFSKIRSGEIQFEEEILNLSTNGLDSISVLYDNLNESGLEGDVKFGKIIEEEVNEFLEN